MKSKINNFNLIFIIAILLISGCASENKLDQANLNPDFPVPWKSDAFAQRFQEATTKNPTVVESAIELSDKYAKLIEEASYLKQENQSLASRNQQLKDQVTEIESKLRETQDELKDTTEVLVEMRLELNNWKTDVLGFREEMRNAQSAQLQALMKIMKALGGEPIVTTAHSNGIGQAVASNR